MKFVLQVILVAILSIVVVYSQYTPDEKLALEKFRRKVENVLYMDYMKEDKFLIRWLRARDLNIPAATEMLKKAIHFRKANNIDSILNETILHFPAPAFYVDGFSYSGRPIMTVDLGRIDMRSILLNGKRAELIRFVDQLIEICEAGIRYIGTRFTRYEINDGILIIDLSGFTLRQHACLACFSVHIEWLQHIEEYAPGLIKNLIFINTPRTYARILNLVKSTLSAKSLQGLTVYGRNRAEWTQKILRLIPANQIRKQFGGTKPEGVPCHPTNFTCQDLVFFKKEAGGKQFSLIL